MLERNVSKNGHEGEKMRLNPDPRPDLMVFMTCLLDTVDPRGPKGK